ncbi:hypothetical protein [Hyphomicrobium sp.]|uniref:hypothetical protein n=1 Tax=Hyphomicrobium sp. TaxID=82 RepID=UPI003F72632F
MIEVNPGRLGLKDENDLDIIDANALGPAVERRPRPRIWLQQGDKGLVDRGLQRQVTPQRRLDAAIPIERGARGRGQADGDAGRDEEWRQHQRQRCTMLAAEHIDSLARECANGPHITPEGSIAPEMRGATSSAGHDLRSESPKTMLSSISAGNDRWSRQVVCQLR